MYILLTGKLPFCGDDNKEIFDEVNFTFESGKIYGLIGRNGIGKTTFFNCLKLAIIRKKWYNLIVK